MYGPDRRKPGQGFRHDTGPISAGHAPPGRLPYAQKPQKTGLAKRFVNWLFGWDNDESADNYAAQGPPPVAPLGFSGNMANEEALVPRAAIPLEVTGLPPNVMHRPFNSDPVVEREVGRLISLFGVEGVVETGTFRGATTEFFAKLPSVNEVYTVEADARQYEFAKERLKPFRRVCPLLGDSAQVLKISVVPHLASRNSPVLFYLDAHWQESWPLQDEILAIAAGCPDRAIIIIDDFYVPNRPFQFDSYKGNANSLEYVEAALEKAYPNGFVHYYNTVSLAPLPVGKLYVIPQALLEKKGIAKEELVFMEGGIPYSYGDHYFLG